MFPDYTMQQVDRLGHASIPIQACIEAAGFDTSPFQPSTLAAYSAAGVQWGMPFNVSQPGALLQPQHVRGGRPRSRPIRRSRSRSCAVLAAARRLRRRRRTASPSTPAADSGGGWYLEQWFANMGELYADNGNGRLAPATQVLYDGADSVSNC